MRVAVVSFYPPQRGRLAEYGEYLAEALGRDVEVAVLAQADPAPVDGEHVTTAGVFDRRRPASLFRVVRAVKRMDADVVLFNQYFGVWGDRYAANLAGVSLPFLVNRCTDAATVTVLHNIYEELEVGSISRAPSHPFARAGLWFGTRMLLRSDAVAVTMDTYRDVLATKYAARNVVHVPHGTPRGRMRFEEAPDPFTVLALGHWGPEKRLEELIEAVAGMDGGVRLRVAGTSHPDYPRHLDRLRGRYAEEHVEFLGYVPEHDLPDVFGAADVLVLPYATATGTSGVYNLAKAYGVPVVATEGSGLERVEREEGGEIVFAPPTPEGLRDRIAELRDRPDRRRELAEAIHAAGRETSFDSVADRYRSLFENLRKGD